MKKLDTMEVPGDKAIEELNRLRGEWPKTKRYPFLIGSDEDFEKFIGKMAGAGKVDPEAIIREALALDVDAWLKEHGPKKKAGWPKDEDELPAQSGILGVIDLDADALKPKIHIGLVESPVAWQLFARLGYGGWDDCPPPYVHVALHRRWTEKYKTSPVYISHDSVEMVAAAPVWKEGEALKLAAEHYAYSHNVVDKEAGTVGNLASALLGSKYWRFWWD